ncbi:unnamed protein product [Lasius platythorax]|uniref:Ras-related protein Rab n=2 Tax=Apocrita TaxID=7400 RepID=A0AAV2N773_9HYME
MRRMDRTVSMTLQRSRRDSDLVLSHFGHLKEHLFKFLVIGDYGVGKTALVRRYTEGKNLQFLIFRLRFLVDGIVFAQKILVVENVRSREMILRKRAFKEGERNEKCAQAGLSALKTRKFSSNYKITIGADFAIKTLDWDPHTKINLQLWDIAGHERFGYMTRIYYKYAVAAALVFDISRAATFQSMKKWLYDLREKITLPDGSDIPIVLLANKCDITVAVTDEQISKFCKENKINAWYATSAKNNTNVDTAMRYLVENVLCAKIDNGVRDSIRLRENLLKHEKSGCCK